MPSFQEEAVESVECVGFDCSVLQEEDVLEYFQQQQSSVSSSEDSVDSQAELLPGQEDLHAASASFQVGGMSCAVCAGRVEQALLSVEGVSKASVTISINRAHVQVLNESALEGIVQECVAAVRQGGYECEIVNVGNNHKQGVTLADNAARMEQARISELRSWRRLLIFSTLLTVPIIVLHAQGSDMSSRRPFLRETSGSCLPWPLLYSLVSDGGITRLHGRDGPMEDFWEWTF